MTQPGSPTAFEDLVDHYDAARPTYPAALFAQLQAELPGLSGRVLELGAGTGIATRELGSARPRSCAPTSARRC